jgi:hypothetical protein
MDCVLMATVVDHNYWTTHEKTTYLIAALNKVAACTLHGIHTGAMYKEVTDVLENHCGDHHLEAAFLFQLKRRTRLIREPLQEFVTDIDHLADHAHVGHPEH